MTAIPFDTVHDALLARGFKQAAALRPIRYAGSLPVGNESVPIQIEFDLELQRLPIVRLEGRPAWIPESCNHVDGRNIICYANSGLAFIDRYHAAEQVLFCLDSATRTLNSIRQGNILGDANQEFAYYWRGTPILVDGEQSETTQRLNVLHIKLSGRDFQILANYKQDALDKYSQYSPELKPLAAAILIPGKHTPAIDTQAWPPKTLQDVMKWLVNQSPDLARALRRSIGSLNGLGVRRALLIFQTEPAWFGIGFALPPTVGQVKFRQPKAFSNSIEQRAAQIAIDRYTPVRIDSEYLIERNLREDEKPLLGKRIVLAGCGAIGGHLAHALARAGAGFGGGTLLLVDPDHLKPGNLGRHRLGLESLLLRKSECLRDDVKRSLPGANIQAMATSILNLKLSGFDLVLDATGEEQLSEALNARFLAGDCAPIIFAWIIGNGLAVQSFTLSTREQGCLRCWKEHIDQTTPAKREEIEARIGLGCDDPFVPFNGASPLLAAGLALQATIDWAAERPNPTLRTLELDHRSTRHIKPKSPSKTALCPACGKN